MTQLKAPVDAEVREAVNDDGMRAFVGYNIKRAYIMVRAAAQAALAEFELSVLSFTALSIVVDNPGITPSQLADLLQIERPNVVAVIDRLEGRGFVTRSRLQSDRRRFALNGTGKGRALQKAAAGAISESEGRLLSALDPGEQASLVRLLDRIEAEGTRTFNHAAGADQSARHKGRKT